AAEREPRRIGLFDAGDHAQALGQLDDAEAERHVAPITGGRGGDRRPAPERARLGQLDPGDLGRAAVRADRGDREVVAAAGGAAAADEATVGEEALLHRAARHQITPSAARASSSPSDSPSASVSTSRVWAPSRGAPCGVCGCSPAKRGKGACCRIVPATGSSTSTRSPRAAKCGSANMSAAVYAVATGTSQSTQAWSTSAAVRARGQSVTTLLISSPGAARSASFVKRESSSRSGRSMALHRRAKLASLPATMHTYLPSAVG